MLNNDKTIQLLEELISSGRFKNKNELASYLGLTDTTKSKLYNFLNGKSVAYDTVCHWFDTLGISLFAPLPQNLAFKEAVKESIAKEILDFTSMPFASLSMANSTNNDDIATIKRIGENAPIDYIDEKAQLQQIPVYGLTGAGGEVELIENEPIAFISILPQYNYSNMFSLKVDGDSMSPTIPKGAYVGVIPHAGNIQEGGVYLVERPYMGRMIKRIKINSSGSLALFSDNPKYEPIPLDDTMLDSEIKGKVMWILCMP